MDNYVQEFLSTASNPSQNSTASLNQEANSPTGPQSYEFHTTAVSHESIQQRVSERAVFPDTVPSSVPSQDIDLSLLQVSEAHTNGLDFDPISFVQSLDGLDSTNWLLEDQFDLSIFDNLNPLQTSELDRVLSNDTGEPPLAPQRAPQLTKRSMPNVSDLRHHWYTQIPLMASGFSIGSRPMTPGDVREDRGEDIDESYRAKLASKLRFPERNEPLPTIEFMVRWIVLLAGLAYISDMHLESLHPPFLHSLQYRSSHCSRAYLSANHRGCPVGAFNMLCGYTVLRLRCSGSNRMHAVRTSQQGSSKCRKLALMIFQNQEALLTCPAVREVFVSQASCRVHNLKSIHDRTDICTTFRSMPSLPLLHKDNRFNINQHPSHLTTASSYHGTLISVRPGLLMFQCLILTCIFRLLVTLDYLAKLPSLPFLIIFPLRSCTKPGLSGLRQRR